MIVLLGTLPQLGNCVGNLLYLPTKKICNYRGQLSGEMNENSFHQILKNVLFLASETLQSI